MVRKITVTKKSVKRNKLASSINNDPTFKQLFKNGKQRFSHFLKRRPHRSFRLTRRRDYARSLVLPGYWSFTNQVRALIWHHKLLFMKLIVAYSLLTVALVGLSSQDTYSELSQLLKDTSGTVFSGGWGEIGKAGLLLISGVTGSFTPQLTEIQQLYSALLFLIVWLTTIWLLRVIMSGNTKPRLRDGIYNAGSPIVATAIILLFLLIQLVPVALAFIGINVAFATEFLTNGIVGMVFWLVVVLLAVMSTYWLTATLMALVIVTLPGMYPWQAMRTAGDLVIGRRVRILLRLVWLMAGTAIAWVLFMVPIVIASSALTTWLPALSWLPIVPVALVLITSTLSVWAASYVYMLYRKVVADDASPA